MEQEKKSFPNYYPGQFLTSDDLNASFAYLEEQERITRVNVLGGYGIINGLSVRRHEKDIVIGSGRAVTSDGYYISFSRSSAYKYLVKYDSKKGHSIDSNPSFLDGAYLMFKAIEEIEQLEWENVDIIDISSSLPDYDFLKDYIGGVIVDFVQDRSVNCNQLSCDLSNSKTNIIGRPAMIMKSKVVPTRLFPPALSFIRADRLNKIIEYRDMKLLRNKMEALFVKNRDLILDMMDQILNLESTTGHICCSTLFSRNDRLYFSRGIERLKSFEKMINGMPPYFLLFIEDMKRALNEYIAFYNYYIKNYSVYCNEGRSNRLIVLEDPYRTYFKPISPDSPQIRDMEILKRLFRRIPAMIIAFKGNNMRAEPISIVPSRRLPAVLGEEAIPVYYFKDDVGFSDLWHTVVTGLLAGTSVENSLDAMNDLFERPFFKINGCYGKKIDDVYSSLNSLVNTYALPIKIHKFGLLKPQHITEKDMECFEQITKLKDQSYALSGDINVLKKALLAHYYRELKKIIRSKDFVYSNGHISFKSVDSMLLAKKGLDDVLTTKQSYAKRYEELNLVPFTEQMLLQLHSFVAPILKLHDILKKICAENVVGTEYTGGAYANSTLILLHWNGRVVMEVNVPEYNVKILAKM